MKKAVNLILLLLATASCSNVAADQKADRIALPSTQNVPVGINNDCDCLQKNKCVMLEERLGFIEVKDLTCDWIEPNKEAQCTLKTRFVAQYSEPNGELKDYPEDWGKIEMTARHMGNNAWCAADLKV